MLELDRIDVRYGRLAAVQNVSLRVGEGEFVGVIGPNGAGKSSTLHAVAGLVRVSSGTVSFEGRVLNSLAPENVVRLGIGLVPEGRHILASLTVAENLDVGMTAARDRRDARKREQRLLERFPVLGKYYRSSAGTLSGGEQQQLAIARALVAGPRLLLLDEPSLGLAPLIVDQVFDTLQELRAEGVTVLLVEQNATRTVEVADRTYVLRTGQIVLEGSRADYQRRTDLAATYLGF
jgi:branched-chain amino acid transport system ATP-binding protein